MGDYFVKKVLFFVFLAGLVTACQPPITREQQLSFYRSRCLDYGYPPGTREFADCMKEQEARDEELFLKGREVAAREERNRIERKRVSSENKDDSQKLTWKLWK